MKASKSIKSKQILLSALVALVLIAGYYRWTKDLRFETMPVTSDAVPKIETSTDDGELSEDNNVDANTADYFEKSKYDRDYARSEAIAVLNQLYDEEISEEQRDENEKEIAKNVEISQTETTIENLIISKGFKNCIVFIEDNSVNVVVQADKLDSKSANQIKDIVLSQRFPDKIKIDSAICWLQGIL